MKQIFVYAIMLSYGGHNFLPNILNYIGSTIILNYIGSIVILKHALVLCQHNASVLEANFCCEVPNSHHNHHLRIYMRMHHIFEA
jgi:hypothetical protein